MKQYKEAKQDAYEGVAQSLQPLLDVERSVKESIDEKQDKIIEQLQRNQLALTQGFDDIIDANQRAIMFNTELPKAIEEEKTGPTKLEIDNDYNNNERTILNNYKLLKPSDLTQVGVNRLVEEKEKSADISKAIGYKKRHAPDKDKKIF